MAEFISTVSLSYPLPSGQNCLYPGDTRLITAAVLVKDEFGNVVPTPSIDTSVHWALKYGSGSLSAASSNSVVYTAASIDPSAYDAIAVVEARSNYRNQTAVSVSGFIATFVSGAPFSQDYAGTWVMIGAGYFLVQSVGSGGGSLTLDNMGGSPPQGGQTVTAANGVLGNALLTCANPGIVINTHPAMFPATSVWTFSCSLFGLSGSVAWSLDPGSAGSINSSSGVYLSPSSRTSAAFGATIRVTCGAFSATTNIQIY